jgi:hypothetical protein
MPASIVTADEFVIPPVCPFARSPVRLIRMPPRPVRDGPDGANGTEERQAESSLTPCVKRPDRVLSFPNPRPDPALPFSYFSGGHGHAQHAQHAHPEHLLNAY